MPLSLVSVEIPFCYGHRIKGHSGKCKHLHGHNGKAVVVIACSQLDELSMVIDFSVAKKKIKEWIDENWDHNFLLATDDRLEDIARLSGREPFVMRNGMAPTAEAMAMELFIQANEILCRYTPFEQNLRVEEVRIAETNSTWASFRSTN